MAASEEQSACTFAVHPDLKAEIVTDQLEEVSYHVRRSFLDKDRQKLVRHACSDGQVLKGHPLASNALVDACTKAFDEHLPLTLRPQFFWLAVCQAVAMHVEGHPEQLREKFVLHAKGKMELELDVTAEACNGFSQENWAGAVAGFDTLLRKHTKEGVVERMSCGDFSNTTAEEHVASMMTCMDAMKSYFDFKMYTCCGFPKVTLEGSTADWNLLRTRAEELVRESTLPEFSDWWLPILNDILDRLASTREAEGKTVDVEFWESFVKRGGTHGSGAATWISGWINAFFPLKTPGSKNPFCEKFVGGDQYSKYVDHWSGGKVPEQKGLETDDFPAGLSSCPVTLDGHPLEFRSGFVGVERTPDYGVKPCVGWFVASGVAPRTKDQFSGEVVDVEQATAIYTAVGAVIPLLDFTNGQ
jgi:Domain of unknown function (DUF4419)